MDRLARYGRDLLDVVKSLTKRDVHFEFVNEGQPFSRERNPMAEARSSLLGYRDRGSRPGWLEITTT